MMITGIIESLQAGIRYPSSNSSFEKIIRSSGLISSVVDGE